MLYAQKKNYFKEKGINASFTQSIFFFNTVGIPSQLCSSPTWTSTGPKKDFPLKRIPSCANTLNNLFALARFGVGHATLLSPSPRVNNRS